MSVSERLIKPHNTYFSLHWAYIMLSLKKKYCFYLFPIFDFQLMAICKQSLCDTAYPQIFLFCSTAFSSAWQQRARAHYSSPERMALTYQQTPNPYCHSLSSSFQNFFCLPTWDKDNFHPPFSPPLQQARRVSCFLKSCQTVFHQQLSCCTASPAEPVHLVEWFCGSYQHGTVLMPV